MTAGPGGLGGQNVFVGAEAGAGAGTPPNGGANLTCAGYQAGYAIAYGVAIGAYSAAAYAGAELTAVGSYAAYNAGTGASITAVGSSAGFGQANFTGTLNTAIGQSALSNITTGTQNTAIGSNAGGGIQASSNNIAIGSNALGNSPSNVIGGHVAIGVQALQTPSNGTNNTAIGRESMTGTNTNRSNCSALGYQSAVTGSNQVQLGNASTTTYAYGAVQDRSDIRDKADVRDTQLGLEFVNALHPVDFKWDMREDYRPDAPAIVNQPNPLPKNPTQEEIEKYNAEKLIHDAYILELENWNNACKLTNITHDGSKKRSRYHHGLIAQEVKSVIDAKGIDFGGFQDHSVKNGDDVLSIGYVELIAPMIKAIQELSAEVKTLKDKLKDQ